MLARIADVAVDSRRRAVAVRLTFTSAGLRPFSAGALAGATGRATLRGRAGAFWRVDVLVGHWLAECRSVTGGRCIGRRRRPVRAVVVTVLAARIRAGVSWLNSGWGRRSIRIAKRTGVFVVLVFFQAGKESRRFRRHGRTVNDAATRVVIAALHARIAAGRYARG